MSSPERHRFHDPQRHHDAHSENCGRQRVQHDDHLDYLHDGHWHARARWSLPRVLMHRVGGDVPPEVRKLLPDLEDDVLESHEEHHVADVLVAEQSGVTPNAELFDAKTTVLIGNVTHQRDAEGQDWFAKDPRRHGGPQTVAGYRRAQ